jgi:hypothetical protein
MITLEEAIRIGYKSSAIAYSSAKQKKALSRDQEKVWRDEMKKHVINSEEWDELRNFALMWNDLTTAFHYQFKYYGISAYGTGMGVKGWLEKCWTEMGKDPAELQPIWRHYERMSILDHLTFTEVPDFDVEAMEEEYAPAAFPVEWTWQQKYTTLLDSLTQDTWRQIAMKDWVRLNTDPASIPNEQAGQTWDLVLSASETFFLESNKCLADCNQRMTQWEHRTEFEQRRDELVNKIHEKYNQSNHNRLIAAGGIFLVNYDDLSDYWKARAEAVPIYYED